jgi:hypothetical protein
VSTSQFVLIGGGFQDSDGNPLAEGTLTARLLGGDLGIVLASDSTTMICPGQAIEYALDDDGNISTDTLQYIIPVDEMTLLNPTFNPMRGNNFTQNLLYLLTAYSADGQLAWGPNALALTSTQATSYVQRDLLAATGSQTVYTLTYTPLANSLFVFRNGVFQTPGVDYSLAGNTLEFFSAPLSSDTVIALYTQGNAPSAVAPTYQAQAFSPGSTTYSLSHTPAAGTVAIFQNGVFQSPGIDYNISSTTITFTMTTFGALYVVYQTEAGFVGLVGQVPSSGVSAASYSLAATPDAESLMFFVNGLYQTPGAVAGSFDYSLNGNQVTFNPSSIPVPGSVLYAMYNAPQIINLNDYAPQNPS